MPARSYQELRNQMSPQNRAVVDQPQPAHMVELLLEEINRDMQNAQPQPEHARSQVRQQG